jgi:hypothetical protein
MTTSNRMGKGRSGVEWSSATSSRTAFCRGDSRWHGVTMILGASVMVENVFHLPGWPAGHYALLTKDYAVVQRRPYLRRHHGCSANLNDDISYGFSIRG